MIKSKLIISMFLALAVVLSLVGTVHASPSLKVKTPITGTVQNIVLETNPDTGIQTVVVTLLVNGETQTVRLSEESATSLGLITSDESGNPVVDETKIGTDVEIDPSTVIVDGPPVEEKQHPVGSKIAEFFSGFMNVDYEMIMSSHTDGFGFGVITQALWMTKKLGGDESLFVSILDAKKNGDYSLITLPDGTIPQNWGQFKKSVLKGEDDNSLGDVMSDKEKNENKPEDPGNGNGKPENPGNGKPENPGNGNGRPDNPPGQDKDKNKENNGNGKSK